MEEAHIYRLASRSARLVNVSSVRCFSAFAPTGKMFPVCSLLTAVKFDGKKIDPHTPLSKSI